MRWSKGKVIGASVVGALALSFAGVEVANATSSNEGNLHGDTTVATVQVTATDSSPVEVSGTGTNYYNPVAHCPSGYVAIGGGWKSSMTNGLTNPIGGNEGPTSDGTGWQGKAAYNASAGVIDVGVTVTCVSGSIS